MMQPVRGNWSCLASRTLLTVFGQEMLSILGGHILAIPKLTSLPPYLTSLPLQTERYEWKTLSYLGL